MGRILNNLNCALSGAAVMYVSFMFGVYDYRTWLIIAPAIMNILIANLVATRQKKTGNDN